MYGGRGRKVVESGMKREPEINGRIDELRDSRVRNVQFCRHLIERQADGKTVFADIEVPEFVLEHDRHFVREPFAQAEIGRAAGRERV